MVNLFDARAETKPGKEELVTLVLAVISFKVVGFEMIVIGGMI
jgi:hypothetical protein